MTTTNTTPAPSFLDDAAPELVEILAHPEDDTPRLIYADWLEDHGDPERAEFIRVQMELANAPEKCLKPLRDGEPPFLGCDICLRVRELREIEHRLFDQHKCKWFGEGTAIHYLEHEREDSEGQYENCLKSIFRRGFLTEVHAPLAVLQKHLPALVRQHPIERVGATDKEPQRLTSSIFTWWNRKWNSPNNHMTEAYWVPGDVFGTLKDDVIGSLRYPNAKDYPTADAAHAALSEAMLRLAKGVNFALES